SKLLREREGDRSPVAEPIKTNEAAHCAKPDLGAQVRFTEWTADNKLRHPVYLGLRDDTQAADVVRASSDGRDGSAPSGQRSAASGRRSAAASGQPFDARERQRAQDRRNPVVEQLRALEDARRDGAIELPDGSRLGVTNL